MIVTDFQRVLSEYPPPVAMAEWTSLGSAGGFSGSRIWRGRTAVGGKLCLKCHAPGADPDRLERVHQWMRIARMAGLRFVPLVEPTRYGQTAVMDPGVWDVTEWMPGAADFHANPTDARLLAAVEAVARLHAAWAVLTPRPPRPCPAVGRRLWALQKWQEFVAFGWRPVLTADDPVAPHAEAALDQLPSIVPRALAALLPWRGVPVPVQPCLCDVWHDHVLFTGDHVSGLIDYGAAKVDHVAVDLARLLGSLIPDEPDRMALALSAYERFHPVSQPELVPLLDRTGVVVGLTNWLRWLYHDGRSYPNRAVVARRVGELVRRLAL
jgi:Ser/Thr protein kinase RdoA (MazF antagonist)